MNASATRFFYRAARQDGSLERGVLDAPERGAAAAALRARGLVPVEIRPARAMRTTVRPILPDDLAVGLTMLADLVDAGLPVTRALGALHELAPGRWRDALPGVIEAVRRGQSLSAAFDAACVLPPVIVGIVRAGEEGSGLADAVRRSAQLAEEGAALRASVRGALAYPAILAIGGVGSVGLLVTVVLPRFAAILGDLGQQLPESTRLVLAAADVARRGALPALGACVLAALAWHRWASSAEGRVRWHATLLTLPVVGAIRRAMGAANGCHAVASLLAGGVPIAAALESGARSCGDASIARRFRLARQSVIRGERLSVALEREGAVTITIVRLARAGEESGRLAAMLAHAARIEGERASRALRSAVRLLEPALIVAFGGVIALVAVALLQAMYGIRPT